MTFLTGAQSVTTPIALAAFALAIGFYAYRSWLTHRRRMIQSIPDAERAELVTKTLRLFSIDASKLSPNRQYDLALEQIRAREERFRVVAMLLAFLAVLLSGLTVFYITRTDAAADRASSAPPLNQALPVKLCRIYALKDQDIADAAAKFTQALGAFSRAKDQQVKEIGARWPPSLSENHSWWDIKETEKANTRAAADTILRDLNLRNSNLQRDLRSIHSRCAAANQSNAMEVSASVGVSPAACASAAEDASDQARGLATTATDFMTETATRTSEATAAMAGQDGYQHRAEFDAGVQKFQARYAEVDASMASLAKAEDDLGISLERTKMTCTIQ